MTTLGRLRALRGSSVGAIAILLLVPALCLGQVSTATVNGTVTDEQGAVIPGASLTLTNTETGVALGTETNEAGVYRFQNVQIGQYTLEASSAGFTTQKLEPFTLTVNQTTTLDFPMQIGAVTETVEVTAAAVQLQSSSAELGQAVEERTVKALPLNGRNFTQMLMLQPGVVMVRPPGSQSLSYTRQVGEAANPSVNGQNNRANVYMLDGVANFETFGNAYAVPPILDAIAEFKVQSHNDSAEFGMGSGGIVNVVTKSGTNEYHGVAFWFLKNDALNARQFNRETIDPFRQNQFGGTIGGPVVRNKTFFFAATQIFRFSTPGARFYNVPTGAQLGGDFSQSGRDIFDPGQTMEDPANPGAFIRPQFPNNQIPQSRLDQSILGYLQATGLPRPTQTERPQFNAIDNRSRTVDQEEWQVKVDHHFSARDTAWFRFSKLDQAGQSSGGREGLVNSNEMDALNFSGSYVHIFSPSMTGQFQFGRSVSDIPTFREFDGVDAAAIAQQAGFPSGIYEYRDGPVLSGISAANYFGGTPVITTNRPANNYQIKGDISVVKGKHTIRFGGDFMFATMSRTQASHGVTFTELATGDLANSATTGDSIASMILNYAESSSRRNIIESLRFGGNQGVYFQDSWKATPKLTVNLGLRFDYAWVPQYGTVADGNIYTGNANTDTGKYMVIKVPGPCSELGGAPCIPTPDGRLPENVVSVGEDSVLFPGRGAMFGPRVGMAYRVSDTTTLRFSAGVVYDNFAGIYQSARGVGGNWPDVSTQRFGILSRPTPSNPRPQVTAQDPILGQSDVPPPTPFNTQWWFVDPEFEQAYSLQWNFGIQHQLMRNTVVEANYVGSGNRDLSLGGRRNTAVTPGPGDPRDRMRFPYMRPTYFEKSIGRSNYNSLQLSMKRSFTNGLAATAAYTWAKSIDIGCSGFFGTEGCSIQNEYDLNGQRSVGANDIPHYFVGSLVYDVPFGRGRKFGSGISTAADHIIGGWQFNTLVNFRGGLPYHVIVPGDIANVGNPWPYIRANLVGDHRLSNPTPERWINTDAFEAPPQFTFGNLGRNTLRPDNVYRFDLSLFKEIAVTEGLRIQIRAEAFNAFNSTMFSNPDANLASIRFGLVTSAQVPPREFQMGLKILF